MLKPNSGNIKIKCLPVGITIAFLSSSVVVAQKPIGVQTPGIKSTEFPRIKNDSLIINGNISCSGLLQTGNEMRTVASLLSDISLAKRNFDVEPLTSIAYSTKPGKVVEREFLENIIIRFFQNRTLYPAIGITVETSLLRKIDYRWAVGPTLVWNILKTRHQLIKLGVGYNHEFTQYLPYAFIPPPKPGVNYYSLNSNQLYIRLKGRNEFMVSKLIFSYDFFIQPSLRDIENYKWVLVGTFDIPFSRKFSFRAIVVDSYEEFVASGVYKNNFRLTYGINLTF